ncbi:hypothetical protein LCGC14_0223920 [marine sediment metagenome]|uniref:Uncharacterized protein n=1 Tax=marine sediment metagenome TaxID=412755 RepID=A0A0F9UGN5_9ZZZZ
MVEWLAINFVTGDQKEEIRNRDKSAFFRMENDNLKRAYKNFNNNKEIVIYTNIIAKVAELEGWLYLSYIDFFKWNSITYFAAIIERAGFGDKDELKEFLVKLYGMELFGDHLDEKPFLYYIEFDYTPFPKHI